VTVKEPVDPVTWKPVTGGFAENITGIAYGGGTWIGIGPDNSAGRSANGTAWTAAGNIGNDDNKLRGGPGEEARSPAYIYGAECRVYRYFGRIFCSAKNRAIRSNFCPCGAIIPLLSLARVKLLRSLTFRSFRSAKTPGIAASVPGRPGD
jgi:hypothetical protein